MRAAKLIILSLLSVVVTVHAQSRTNTNDQEDNPFANNADFWQGLDEEEEPYEHDFTKIPDLINNKTVYFWFN